MHTVIIRSRPAIGPQGGRVTEWQHEVQAPTRRGALAKATRYVNRHVADDCQVKVWDGSATTTFYDLVG